MLLLLQCPDSCLPPRSIVVYIHTCVHTQTITGPIACRPSLSDHATPLHSALSLPSSRHAVEDSTSCLSVCRVLGCPALHLAMKPTAFIVDRQTAALREISKTYLQPWENTTPDATRRHYYIATNPLVQQRGHVARWGGPGYGGCWLPLHLHATRVECP